MREYFSHVTRGNNDLRLKIVIGYFEGKDVYILRNNQMVKVDPLEEQEATLEFTYPLMTSEPGLLQSLVDGLINFGVKPTEPLPDNNEMKSVKYHLEDMRKLVFEEDK